MRLSLWYRTAKPDEPAEVVLCYLDQNKAHIAYRNQHIGLPAATAWTRFERTLEPPAGAAFIQPMLEGAPWTERGEKVGTVWVDDLSLNDTGSGAELLADGGFEAAKPLGAEARVTFDCQAWDEALARATKDYHFNNFVLGVPGLGGGTFYARAEGELLGFRQGSPEYQALFKAWCDGARAHLAERGLLDKAVCYPFDEPGEKDYPFVVNQLRLLKENFEYLALLKRLLAAKRARLPAAEIATYEALLVVPPEISKSLTDWTKDPAPLEARRQQIAKAIEGLAQRQ